MIESNTFAPQFGNKWRTKKLEKAQEIMRHLSDKGLQPDVYNKNEPNSFDMYQLGEPGKSDIEYLIASNVNNQGKPTNDLKDLRAIAVKEKALADVFMPRA